jgi:NCAIR mutase (PurE)-related protein
VQRQFTEQNGECYNLACPTHARRRQVINQDKLRDLLDSLRDGAVSVDDALARLKDLPYEDMGFAALDHHRTLRRGFPEVVYGEGKTAEQVAMIGETLARKHGRLLVTRIEPEVYVALKERVPGALYNTSARAAYFEAAAQQRLPGVTVCSAGTSDQPVAEEASLTAEVMGCSVERTYDVGVAGLHRLLDKMEVLRESHAIVVVAGMEGALPSVVAGLVSAPVIAVPTSVGYGASFQGLAPMLAMLNSCAPGVSVVNIDNGFGAGYLAAVINHQTWEGRND